MATIDSPLLHLHPDDNVFVAKSALALGQTISELGVRTRAQVPAGHKIAARHIAAGEQVKKFDTVIGVATRDLAPGDYVHSHNLKIVDYYRDPARVELRGVFDFMADYSIHPALQVPLT